MFKVISITICITIFILSASNGHAFVGEDQIAFEKAKKIALDNCADCRGKTKQGLELAVSELENLLGRPQPTLEFYLLLADVYRLLAIRFYPHDDASGERAKLLEKEVKVLTLAAEIKPDDIELLHRLALSLSGDSKIDVLRRIIELDPNNAIAHILIALSTDDPDVALQYGYKAYELASPDEKENIGENLRYLLSRYSGKDRYIELHLRSRNEENIARNMDLSASRQIKITLEPRENLEVYHGDLTFDVVFTNISEKPLRMFNHRTVSSEYFWFTVYPDYPDRELIKPANYNEEIFDASGDSAFIEIQPNSAFRVEASLSQILPAGTKLENGGYIISLMYRGDFIRSASKFPSAIYSNAVHFQIANFKGGAAVIGTNAAGNNEQPR